MHDLVSIVLVVLAISGMQANMHPSERGVAPGGREQCESSLFAISQNFSKQMGQGDDNDE